MSEKECILDIPVEHLENIFGQFDANIKLIEQTLSGYLYRTRRPLKGNRRGRQDQKCS